MARPRASERDYRLQLSTAFSEQRREDLLEEIRPLLEQVIEVVAVDMKGGSGLSGP